MESPAAESREQAQTTNLPEDRTRIVVRMQQPAPESTGPGQKVRLVRWRAVTPTDLFNQKLLNFGIMFALALASVCLWACVSYLNHGLPDVSRLTSNDVQGDFVSYNLKTLATTSYGRLGLLSGGVYVGMTFGFLGFALFLLAFKGEMMDVDAKSNSHQIKIARMSPGIFVILCSAVLVGTCATRSGDLKYVTTNAETQPSGASAPPKVTPESLLTDQAADLKSERKPL